MKKTIILAITAYQLVRFLALALPLAMVLGGTGGARWSLLVAVASTGLIVPLLSFRLALAAHRSVATSLTEILTSAKILETVAMVVLMLQILRSPMPLLPQAPGAVSMVASILLLADFVILLFLLLYGRSREAS